MNALAIIPARAGSKRLPGKNVRKLGGITLLERAIRIGVETCAHTVVSTDSEEYARITHFTTASVVKRPKALAQDDTPMLPVVQHVLAEVDKGKFHPSMPPSGFDVVVLLEPTSPLRTAEHVREALDMLDTDETKTSVVSVVEVPARYSAEALVNVEHPMIPGPSLTPSLDPGVRYVDRNGVLAPVRGLDAMTRHPRTTHYRDGTVYAIRRQVIEECRLYGDNPYPLVIPPDESATIDTEDDWQRAEALLRARGA